MSISLALTLLKVSFCWFVLPSAIALVMTAFARRSAGFSASRGWSFFLCGAAALMVLVDLALTFVGFPVKRDNSVMLLYFTFVSFPLLTALAMIREAFAIGRSGPIATVKSDRITLATFAIVLCLVIPLSFLSIAVWRQIAHSGSALQLKPGLATWLVQLCSPPIFVGLLLLLMMVRLRPRVPREYRVLD
jgi:hypothetical protein